MVKICKRLKIAKEKVNPEKLYNLDDAILLIKTCANAKFDETVDIALNMGLDPRHADQMIRAVTSLPNGLGKEIRVAVFAKAEKAEEARKAGADIVGADDLIEDVKSGKINFDKCIATPDMMAKVGTIGKILGPKNLMPNPKLGTVTLDVGNAVKAAKAGQVEIKLEKAGIIQAAIGKASFDAALIKQNIIYFVQAVIQAKPSGAKGTYFQRASVSSTMGPGIKIDLTEILTNAA